MYSRLALVSLFIIGSSAFADRMAISSTGFSDFEDREEKQVQQKTVQAPSAPLPITPTVTSDADQPVATPVVKAKPARPKTQREIEHENYERAELACKAAWTKPYATSSPLKVFVDQQRQEMTVTSPDFPQALVVPVSTGGTLKIPRAAGSDEHAPYYACTPQIEARVVTAIEPHEVEAVPECRNFSRGMSTVFTGDAYKSNLFTHDGVGVTMPNAVRTGNNGSGIFIHRVPPSYVSYIGQNVSGECIRVQGWTKAPKWMEKLNLDNASATIKDRKRQVQGKNGKMISVTDRQIEISETINKQMKKYGAMELAVSPPKDAICYESRGARNLKALEDAVVTGNYVPTDSQVKLLAKNGRKTKPIEYAQGQQQPAQQANPYGRFQQQPNLITGFFDRLNPNNWR